MPPTAAAAWLGATAPSSNRPADVYAFFGCPPDPMSSLPDNVAKKRRTWTAKASGRGDRAAAEQVLQLVTRLGEAVLRDASVGDVPVAPAPSQPRRPTAFPPPATVGDLWRQVERLLFRSQYTEAIKLACRYRQQHQGDAVVAHAVAVAATASAVIDPPTLREGLEAAVRAVGREQVDPVGYEAGAVLAELLNDTATIDRLVADATKHLPSMPGPLRAAHVASITDDRVRLVTAARYKAGADEATVAAIVATLLGRARQFLPIADAGTLRSYRELVDTAAWIADGVADAEFAVRPHRLWAVHAGARIAGGSTSLRALVAVCTLGLGVPVLQAITSRPVWQVLADGPGEPGSEQTELHAAIARAPHVRAIHV